MRELLHVWFNSGDLYQFEKLIIHEVKRRLAQDGGERLQMQFDTINKVQRLSEGKEVNLYCMRRGKAMFDDDLRFPYAADEALLATVSLSNSSGGPKLKAEVWLAKGRLFSLVFNKPPKQFFEGSSLKQVKPNIADIKIWLDPMRPDNSVAGRPANKPVLTGWLQEWGVKDPPIGLWSPLPESERSAFLARIDAQLPKDYLALVAESDGADFSKIKIYGVHSIRKIVWPETSYYVLAEIKGIGDLAVEEGKNDSEIYLLHYENNDAVSLGTSLGEAVANSLKSFCD
jgi:hypothetical protein